jgi:cytochrome P450
VQTLRSPERRPPGPTRNLLIDRRSKFLRSSLKDYLIDSFNRYGDFVAFRFSTMSFYLVAHPTAVEYVLRVNADNYIKANLNYDALKELFGGGIITAEGSDWLRQRRLIQPSFQHRSIVDFGPLITHSTLAMLDRLESLSLQNQVVDLLSELSSLTLRILGLAFLGTDLSRQAAIITKAWAAANEYFGRFRLDRSLPFSTWKSARSRAAVRMLHRLSDHLIRRRLKSKRAARDLLDIMISAYQEAPDEKQFDNVRDNVVTFILTGHETTATALAWTWYLLARHPAIEQQLRAELAEILRGRPPAVSDLPRLTTTRMVLEESMRLYPPAWFISRCPLEDDLIGGYRIPKGSLLILSPYVTHRHPAFWPNPEHFDPHRFETESFGKRPRFSYFPFGGGPRSCIGSSFAMLEMQLILATVAQRYHFKLVSPHAVEEQTFITLRPRHGLKVTVHPVDC